MVHKIVKTENYLLVVDDSEIKVGDWIRWDNKIRRAVDTAYLPTTKKIIAHLPLNHLPILKGVPLLPPCSDTPTYFDCQVGVCSRWMNEDCDKDCCGIPEKTITSITALGIQWMGNYLY